MGNATHGIECFCDMTTTDIHDDGIANAFVTPRPDLIQRVAGRLLSCPPLAG